MPRITHVKKAQQRYETKPVIDPETGEQKRTPVMVTRGGERVQKVTKKGRPVFMDVTERDLTKPKPLLSCDFPGCQINDGKIAIGSAYKHITPKSGPYGGRQKNRHAEHPNWHQWEYSSSLSARIAQIQYETNLDGCESADDITVELESAADQIEELASEKRESAENIESGFGTSTFMSEELNETADALDQWAEDLRQVDLPEEPDPEEIDCETCEGSGEEVPEVCTPCQGSGQVGDDEDGWSECSTCEGAGEQVEICTDCDGTGRVTPDEPTEEQMEEWLSECIEIAQAALDDCPV